MDSENRTEQTNRHWAHTPNGLGEWHDLRCHLDAVAELAGNFASEFGAGEWARIAGLWHDLGKYRREFQEMLHTIHGGGVKHRVDHSTVGAIHAARVIGAALASRPETRAVEFLQLLVTATIAGHHAGLPEGREELRSRLDENARLYEEVLEQRPPPDILSPIRKLPSLPGALRGVEDAERRLRAEFLVRMVFSALVDADRLDSERFTDGGLPEKQRASRLRGAYASIHELRAALDDHIDRKVAALALKGMNDVERRVFNYRQTVLRACREAASKSPGAFALGVATGGGKTLSSLSFALRHAENHRKNRVIVVIPFTSIIEQTAAEYRAALGDLAGSVVEHHSAMNEGIERQEDPEHQDEKSRRSRLATENWDARLIVTTAVQFFESLFSFSASRCRKLHNVVGSVIVIDEAQMLPPQLLNPTVWAINELVERYSATVVLSTATQPSLRKPFPEVRNLTPIVGAALKEPPRRVSMRIVEPDPILWPDLAAHLARHRQVLCITHHRRDARDLVLEMDKLVGDTTTLHLSASMCAAHRSTRIATVKRRLAEGLPCRVISTQLVEAGVDLDFPVVYRALAGVDSLVQAAGRANREGRLGESGGTLFVYRPQTKPPSGLPTIAADAARGLLQSAAMDGRDFDLFGVDASNEFFRLYYERIDDKDGGITPKRREFRFREVDAAFRFIRDGTVTLVVARHRDARKAVQLIRRFGPSRDALRALQRHGVSIYPDSARVLLEAAAVETLLPGDEDGNGTVYLLRDESKDLYGSRFGLDLSNLETSKPGTYIV